VSGKLRIDLAQYRELVTFAQFGSEIEKTTQAQLTRGERMVELLKQDQFKPMPMARQVMLLYAGTHGALDELPVSRVREFEEKFLAFADAKFPALERSIEKKQALDAEVTRELDEALRQFGAEFAGDRE
jgi:F-type H+/Na+-transporting ATPase subunit alpha